MVIGATGKFCSFAPRGVIGHRRNHSKPSKLMSEMFHSLIPIISQITYKNDFNRNSFFLPSAGEALADIYDEEIVPFYDSEMVYQCDKI